MSEDKVYYAQVIRGRINCTPMMNAENVPMVPLDYCKRMVEEAWKEGKDDRAPWDVVTAWLYSKAYAALKRLGGE